MRTGVALGFLGCAALLLRWSFIGNINSEIVDVKFRGPVSLKSFSCFEMTSSFVNRICHDAA
jgi:hypothetical protein